MVKRCPFINTIFKMENPISLREEAVPIIGTCIKKECTFYIHETDNCTMLEAAKSLVVFKDVVMPEILGIFRNYVLNCNTEITANQQQS